ncbi:MAG: bifunctional hydroxymethylpyrimidine kinase/phosphomethylpyrimidine kinase [Desulfotalea sp.]
MKTYTRVLSIAGSDSGGGAGIQADLKTFSACGCYGMTAITAITAQNTMGVTAISGVSVDILQAQLEAVLEDIGVDAIKIGMLHSTEVITCVADILAKYKPGNVVLDPVMVATSGDPLIEDAAIRTMQEELFPLVDVITPNVPEASILLGKDLSGITLAEVAEELSQKYEVSALAKAGHLIGEKVEDVLFDQLNSCLHTYKNKRIDSENTHGTGCSLSSAIASHLALGFELSEAVGLAIDYLHGALVAGADYKIGSGHGPVHHFHKVW